MAQIEELETTGDGRMETVKELRVEFGREIIPKLLQASLIIITL